MMRVHRYFSVFQPLGAEADNEGWINLPNEEIYGIIASAPLSVMLCDARGNEMPVCMEQSVIYPFRPKKIKILHNTCDAQIFCCW